MRYLQNVPRISGILNDFSFLDFFRNTVPMISVRQRQPNTAVNAVSTFGWCGISKVRSGLAAVAVTVTVVVAVVSITAETVVVAVTYNVFVTMKVALYSSKD